MFPKAFGLHRVAMTGTSKTLKALSAKTEA